jgi:hypothetical protein
MQRARVVSVNKTSLRDDIDALTHELLSRLFRITEGSNDECIVRNFSEGTILRQPCPKEQPMV